MKNLLFLVIVFLFVQCESPTETTDADTTTETPTYERIASLDGSITETLFALGHGDKVIAVDVTSTYPADQLSEVPRLGHVRQLNVEGVLAAQPDLIILTEESKEMPAVQQLQETNIELLFLAGEDNLDAPVKMAKTIAEKLGGEVEATAIAEKIENQKAQLQGLREAKSTTPKVLFIYARGTGNMMVAGTDTPAQEMIELAGGQNAVTEFDGFQALSAEGLLQVQPDAILLFESGLQSLGGKEGLMQVEGIAQTPAGKNDRFIAMDGLYLLGFTPRAGEAALELAEALKGIETAQ